MEKGKNLFKLLIIEQLYTLYKSKGIEVEKNEEDMILNINKLAEPSEFYRTKDGKEKKYIPLSAKELAWKLLYPDGSIETPCEMRFIKNGDVSVTAKCYLYRNMEEKEKNLPCAMLEKDFLLQNRYDSFTPANIKYEALRPYAIAIVTSHCLTKFGLGLGVDAIDEDVELTTASVDKEEKENEEKENDFCPFDEVVDTEIKNGTDEDFLNSFEETTVEEVSKPKKGRPKKVVTDNESTVTPDEETESAVAEVVKEIPTEIIDDGVQTSLFDTEKAQEEEEDFSNMTLEEALSYPAEIGKRKGSTLKEIIDIEPNHFKFLATKGKGFERFSLKGQKALEIIVTEHDDVKDLMS